MHKYKNFLMLLFCLAYILLCVYFPISFDNNDDQGMFFINAGILSGTTSSTLLFINSGVGFFLKTLFDFSANLNWYTILLQSIQFLSIMSICYYIIESKSLLFIDSLLIVSFLFFGVFALSIVKLQYTTIAIFSAIAALFSLQNEKSGKKEIAISLFFIAVSILIRKDSFYIFTFFFIPIIVFNLNYKKRIKYYARIFIFSVFLFLGFTLINKLHPSYRQAETYKYLKAIDDVVDKPISYNKRILDKFKIFEEDITLMKCRFPSQEAYTIGEKIIPFSKEVKSYRTIAQLKEEFVKFISDERYLLFIYLLSILVVIFCFPKYRFLVFMNFCVFAFLIFYLALSIRIPHRVTFPILIYITIFNLALFIKFKENGYFKTAVISLFFLIACYKFYCTSKLYGIQHKNHKLFIAYQKEIDAHPNTLFIALYDGYPVQYMNAWTPPNQLNQQHNLILTGWNIWAPDFPLVLRKQHLNNLMTDLKSKKNVLFLTEMDEFISAYIFIMKNRYKVNCHFESVEEEYKTLRPKRLVFDN